MSQRRVVIEAPIILMRQLRAKLVLQGITLKDWFIRQAQDEINKD